jgi:heme a synthase
MGWMQVLLGITTLLTFVPGKRTFSSESYAIFNILFFAVPLAATHQSGSLILLSTAIWLTHELKYLKHIPK